MIYKFVCSFLPVVDCRRVHESSFLTDWEIYSPSYHRGLIKNIANYYRLIFLKFYKNKKFK